MSKWIAQACIVGVHLRVAVDDAWIPASAFHARYEPRFEGDYRPLMHARDTIGYKAGGMQGNK